MFWKDVRREIGAHVRVVDQLDTTVLDANPELRQAGAPGIVCGSLPSSDGRDTYVLVTHDDSRVAAYLVSELVLDNSPVDRKDAIMAQDTTVETWGDTINNLGGQFETCRFAGIGFLVVALAMVGWSILDNQNIFLAILAVVVTTFAMGLLVIAAVHYVGELILSALTDESDEDEGTDLQSVEEF